MIRQRIERPRNGIAKNRTDATSKGMAMNGADGDELTGNGMEVELKGSDMTRAEMAERGAEKLRMETMRIATAWRRGHTIRHGKAKNGAHGRSCGIAQLGTDHQGDGEAAMGRNRSALRGC